VRHAVAAGIVNVHHIAGEKNPADVLSEHWDLPSVWNVMNEAAVVLELEVDGSKRRGGKGRKQH